MGDADEELSQWSVVNDCGILRLRSGSRVLPKLQSFPPGKGETARRPAAVR